MSAPLRLIAVTPILALAVGCSSITGTAVASTESTAPPDASSWRIPGQGKVGARDPKGADAELHADRVAVPFLSAKAYDVARSRLTDLDVKGKAPLTGYDRDEFGAAWSDAAGDFDWTRNGCDTRNDALKRDLVDEIFKAGTGECKVVAGTLPYEPYTGERDRRFDSTDNDYATDLDAEHVVALGNAWVTGAFMWAADMRAAFANDPLVVMMVDPSANRQKGDGDAATWLPKNKPYRCAYVSRQIAVKFKYGLWLSPAEGDAMTRILDGCR